MQREDAFAELQMDLERLRTRLEHESLRHVDAMREKNEELRGLVARLERMKGEKLRE